MLKSPNIYIKINFWDNFGTMLALLVQKLLFELFHSHSIRKRKQIVSRLEARVLTFYFLFYKMMPGRMGLPLAQENPLSISWHDSNWIPMLNPQTVMDYFSEKSNPFYDRTCNNENVKMQRQSLEQLK